jgi:hypothetical protein
MTINELEEVVFQLVIKLQRITGDKLALPQEWQEIIDSGNNRPSFRGLPGVVSLGGAAGASIGVLGGAAGGVLGVRGDVPALAALKLGTFTNPSEAVPPVGFPQLTEQETQNYGGASDYNLKDYVADTNNNTTFITEALPQILNELKNGNIETIANIASLLQFDERYRDFFLVWYASDDEIKQMIRLFLLLHSNIELPTSIESTLFSDLTDEQKKWLNDSLAMVQQLQEMNKNKASERQNQPTA